MVTWKTTVAPADAGLMALLPLIGDTTNAVAEDMARSGHGTHCGQCGKPFNLTRKPRGVARVKHVSKAGTLHVTAWLLCGRCRAEMQRNGGKVSPKLLAEARAAAEAGLLAVIPAKGIA